MSEDTLSKIYDYLQLDSMTDGRLKVKRDIMKKTILLAMQMKEGTEKEFIDKIANRTNVSTRKIREDYIHPLITDGILETFGNGHIRFVGISKTTDTKGKPFTEYSEPQTQAKSESTQESKTPFTDCVKKKQEKAKKQEKEE